MNPKTLLVRLRQYAPKAGFVVRDYRYRHNNPESPFHMKWFTFKRAGVWVRVPFEVGMILRTKQQNSFTSVQTPPVFEVCTDAEARALDEQARLERERKKALEEPTVDTAIDMTFGVDADRKAALSEVSSSTVDTYEGDAEEDEDDEDDEAEEQEPTPSLEWSKRELLVYARDQGLDVKDNMTKAKILAVIQSN